MENKTTTELLNLLQKLVDKHGTLLDGWGEAYDELVTREPFNSILKASGLDETLEERIEDLETIVKELKRHKHDTKSGDVMIRI